MLRFRDSVRHARRILILIAAGLIAPAAALAADTNPERALNDGRVDEAIVILKARVAQNPRDAASHLLLCRAYYALEQLDPAVSECEAARNNGGNADSAANDWMGRAYGRKADHAGPLSGFSLARKVRACFEKAVDLNPSSAAAVNDLSEYYVGAPSVVGGGLDKALALADKVQSTLPQSAHRIRALVAEKKKDYGTAEREFRAAAEGPGKSNGWVDLGDFYSRRSQPDQAVTALRKALASDAAKDSSLVDIASILIALHRDPRLAESALRDYLASPGKSDASPAFHAHYLLGQLHQQAGDKSAAKAEYEAALALASTYAPARKALQSI